MFLWLFPVRTRMNRNPAVESWFVFAPDAVFQGESSVGVASWESLSVDEGQHGP